jgi:hypothetical protein
MSGIGHFAAGFVAKSAAAQTPLWVLLAASEVNDLLYLLFTTVGIEHPARFTMDFNQGVKYLTPGSNPWSHGLFMSVAWSVVAAGLAYLVYRNRWQAGIIGLVVFSHWGLDFLMHSNLPLFFDGSPLVGLGLENSGAGFIFMTGLDLALLAGGIALYLVSRRRTAEKARASWEK